MHTPSSGPQQGRGGTKELARSGTQQRGRGSAKRRSGGTTMIRTMAAAELAAATESGSGSGSGSGVSHCAKQAAAAATTAAESGSDIVVVVGDSTGCAVRRCSGRAEDAAGSGRGAKASRSCSLGLRGKAKGLAPAAASRDSAKRVVRTCTKGAACLVHTWVQVNNRARVTD